MTGRRCGPLARLTEVETRKALDQVRREMAEARHISNDLATKINERVTTILDANVIAASQSQAIEQALSELFEQDAVFQAVKGAAAPRPLT